MSVALERAVARTLLGVPETARKPKEEYTAYTLRVVDEDGSLLRILKYLRKVSLEGHSVEFKIDDERFGLDGDGDDKLVTIEVDGKEVAAVNMQALADALEDLKGIAVDKGALTKADFKEVADDYSLNPTLLENKFTASYGDGSNLRKVAESLDPAKHLSAKNEKTLADLCKYHQVPRNRVVGATYKGKPITIVCRTRGGSVIGVSHEDGRAYRWNAAALRNMKFAQKPQESPKEEAGAAETAATFHQRSNGRNSR